MHSRRRARPRPVPQSYNPASQLFSVRSDDGHLDELSHEQLKKLMAVQFDTGPPESEARLEASGAGM